MMKDELGGKIMTEFVSLRAKRYTYRKIDRLAAQYEDKKMENKRCKGQKKCVIAESLTFDDYKACLLDGETKCRERMLLENKQHEVYTVNKHQITYTETMIRGSFKQLV